VPVPVLVKVTLFDLLCVPTNWTANLTLVVESRTAGTPTPAPVRLTTWGLPAALSVIVIEAERMPTAVGMNLTVSEQVAPPTRDVPQLLVSLKSPGLAPFTTMLEIVRRALPEFVSVTTCGLLIVPRF